MDTILVADGIYAGAGNSGLNFGGRRGILLHSENGPRYTIIDCQGSVTERRRGFTFDNGEDSTFVVDGFTIKHGYGEVFMATACGGGMLFDQSSPTIRNCVFAGNSAVMGGAIFTRINSPKLINCTFVGNSANYGAALMSYDDSAPVLANCIIAFNQGSYPAFCLEFGTVTTVCSDVYGNTHGNWVGCLAGQEGVDGNFSADPLFCNVGIGDVGLVDESSPCTPANNDCAVLIGALNVGCTCDYGTVVGDVNADDVLDPVDVAYVVSFVYKQQDSRLPFANCPYEAGDVDCSGLVDPLDVAYYVNAVYQAQNAFCDPCA
ncbi:right-handed parallel beta-helix repeat-containing protein [Candidatus Zixiibacteriota bacterium]